MTSGERQSVSCVKTSISTVWVQYARISKLISAYPDEHFLSISWQELQGNNHRTATERRRQLIQIRLLAWLERRRQLIQIRLLHWSGNARCSITSQNDNKAVQNVQNAGAHRLKMPGDLLCYNHNDEENWSVHWSWFGIRQILSEQTNHYWKRTVIVRREQ